ncbi:synaptojanin-2-binding protein isoform 1-T1 [Chlamydotis macqueenii]
MWRLFCPHNCWVRLLAGLGSMGPPGTCSTRVVGVCAVLLSPGWRLFLCGAGVGPGTRASDCNLKGLGFNIVGGTDQQYISNDSSIYVSRIKKDGAAYLDGRLQEGDKILSVNGRDLKDLRHKDAVELFRNAGYDVSLKIQRRLQPQNGPVGHQGHGESGGLPLAAILVPGLALAAAAVWIFLRYRQRM